MRYIATLLFAALVALPAVAEYEPEQERVTKSFDLAEGGSVDVSRIPGPVEIATTAVGKVDIDIVRSAPTREDLDCGSVVIEHTPARVVISTEDKCPNVRGSQHVRLTVPRGAALSLRTIAGFVRVGPTDTMLRLDSIAGHVEVSGVREARISSIAGGLDLDLSRVGERGIRVSSVTGGIDLGTPAGTDAEIQVHSLAGSLHNDLPGLRVVEENGSDYRAVLGSGGPKIVLESIQGSVKIHS